VVRVVGHKPTYGLVPYTGCLGIEMTLDHVGPMADTVANAARLLGVIAGEDPLDPRQRGGMPPPVDYTAALGKSIKGLRIAVVHEGFGQTAESWGSLACRRAIPSSTARSRRRCIISPSAAPW